MSGMLSRPRILDFLKAGEILIDPFREEQLGSVSYDVRLGVNYFKEQPNEGGMKLFNPYSEEDVKRVWGAPRIAEPLREWLGKPGRKILELAGVDPDEQVIFVEPGETILCHTEEFVGGKGGVATEMKSRSSMGRIFIAVCKCASLGNAGFFNRWTMEVTNFSPTYTIPLVVGRRIAQITFHEVEPVAVAYGTGGKYQDADEIAAVREAWSPAMMLPALFKDRETETANSRRLIEEIVHRHGSLPETVFRHGFAPPSHER